MTGWQPSKLEQSELDTAGASMVDEACRTFGERLGPAFRIRSARNSDSQAIRRFIKGIRAEFGIAIPEHREKDLGDIQAFYQRRRGFFLLLESDRAMGTFAFVPVSESCGEIRKFYLAPQLRGQGLGTQIILLFLDYARRLGIRSVRAETNHRLGGVRFFMKAGFQPLDPDERTRKAGLLSDDFFLTRSVSD